MTRPANTAGRWRRSLPDSFEKDYFVRELHALGAWTDHTQATMALLGDRFTRAQLSDAIDEVRTKASVSGKSEESNDALLALTRANYRLNLPPGADISELVIFPFSDNERRGIEDMRLVRFTDDDGSSHYYGTYTAFDGFRIFPQLLEYRQDGSIEIHMLSGSCAKNKGMALFPRKIGGKYAMVARLDNENLYYMESDDVLRWDRARLLQKPKFPWEVIQIGNCGSPLETDAGWLLLTHGVGPMRQYCIGATLLDHDDPCRVIGQTSEPLLVPSGKRAYRLCPERRLLVRRHDPRGSPGPSLRDERLSHEHRRNRPRRVAGDAQALKLLTRSIKWEQQAFELARDNRFLDALVLQSNKGNFLMSEPRTSATASFLNYAPVSLAFGTSGLRGLVKDITDLEAYINVKAALRYFFEH